MLCTCSATVLYILAYGMIYMTVQNLNYILIYFIYCCVLSYISYKGIMLRLLRATSFARTRLGQRTISSTRARRNEEYTSAQDWIDDPEKGRALIFGKTWCGFSQMAISALELQEANPHVVQLDLLQNGEAIQQELAEITGMRTVPSIWINGHFIGGYSELSRVPEADLNNLLEEAGALESD